MKRQRVVYFFAIVLLIGAWCLVLHHTPKIDAKPEPMSNASVLPDPVTIPKPEPTRMIVEATAYCQGSITSRGSAPRAGRTVSVDPKIIPYGSHLVINGQDGFVAEDCGNSWSDEMNDDGTYYRHIRGHRIDIYFSSEEEAYAWGRKTVVVEILN